MQLMVPIKDKGYALIDNLGRVIEISNLSRILYNAPIWKHIYHTLYWFDYWFAGPENYLGAPFHTKNLDSLDIKSESEITKEQLFSYYSAVSDKSKKYLDRLNDAMLTEQPRNSETNRLGLILGQFRHAYAHIGMINCTTVIDTGEWPFVAGRAADVSKDLFE